MAILGTAASDFLIFDAAAAGDATGYEVRGADGDDCIITGFEGAAAYGDAGDDAILMLGAGPDFADGGTGDDFLIDIGGGDDTLRGQTGSDWLDGGYGNDRLEGGDGNDQIFGGFGDDHMFGGAGDDWLWGQEGADVIVTGDGRDVVFAGAGNDEIYAGAGDEVLSGDDGADFITAGAGTDFLFGGTEFDWLDAGDGTDLIFGGSGNDKCIGNNGQDQIWGGAGTDSFVTFYVTNYQVWTPPADAATTHDQLGLFHKAAAAGAPTFDTLAWDAWRHDVVADWSEDDNDVIDIPGMIGGIHWGNDLMSLQAMSDGVGGTYVYFLSGVDSGGTATLADDVNYYSVLAQLLHTDPATIAEDDFVLQGTRLETLLGE